MAGTAEGSGGGVILRRFGGASSSTVSSSLSRLRSRGLSAGGEDATVGATGEVRAAWTSSSTVAGFGAIAAGEDGNGEDVVEDGRWVDGVVLAAAAPQVHFQKQKYTLASHHTRMENNDAPSWTFLKVCVPTVSVLSVRPE